MPHYSSSSCFMIVTSLSSILSFLFFAAVPTTTASPPPPAQPQLPQHLKETLPFIAATFGKRTALFLETTTTTTPPFSPPLRPPLIPPSPVVVIPQSQERPPFSSSAHPNNPALLCFANSSANGNLLNGNGGPADVTPASLPLQPDHSRRLTIVSSAASPTNFKPQLTVLAVFAVITLLFYIFEGPNFGYVQRIQVSFNGSLPCESLLKPNKSPYTIRFCSTFIFLATEYSLGTIVFGLFITALLAFNARLYTVGV